MRDARCIARHRHRNAKNLYFALELPCAPLPFHVLAGMRGLAARARAALMVRDSIAGLCRLLAGFQADNPCNTVFPQRYLHNAFACATGQYPELRAVLAAAACGLASTRLRPPGSAWIHPFAGVFLAASWLVESRCVLVPFVLWLVLRGQRARRTAYATLALWLVLAVFILSGTAGRGCFP